jgi:hypothetical protein
MLRAKSKWNKFKCGKNKLLKENLWKPFISNGRNDSINKTGMHEKNYFTGCSIVLSNRL